MGYVRSHMLDIILDVTLYSTVWADVCALYPYINMVL